MEDSPRRDEEPGLTSGVDVINTAIEGADEEVLVLDEKTGMLMANKGAFSWSNERSKLFGKFTNRMQEFEVDIHVENHPQVVPGWLTDEKGYLCLCSKEDVFHVVADQMKQLSDKIYSRDLKIYEARVREMEEKIAQAEKEKEAAKARAKANKRNTVRRGSATVAKKRANPKASSELEQEFDISTIEKPIRPSFVVEADLYLGAAVSSQQRKRMEHPHHFATLAEEWVSRKEERIENLSIKAIHELRDQIVQCERLNHQVLLEDAKILLQNSEIHKLCPEPVLEIASKVVKELLSMDHDDKDLDLSQVLATLCCHESTCKNVHAQHPDIFELLIKRIDQFGSNMLSSSPPAMGVTLLAAACSISYYNALNETSVDVQKILVNLVRRGNDGEAVLHGLVVLSNTFPQFCANQLDADIAAKRRMVGLISDIIAAPHLAIRDVNRNLDYARCDLGSMFLASSTLVNACLNVRVEVGSRLLYDGGAIRRVFSLAEWAYDSQILYEATFDDAIYGIFAVPKIGTVLRDYLHLLNVPEETTKHLIMQCTDIQDEVSLGTARAQIGKIMYAQAVYLLAVATFDVEGDTDISTNNQILLDRIGAFFLRSIKMVRSKYSSILITKQQEQTRLEEALEIKRQNEALKRMEREAASNGNNQQQQSNEEEAQDSEVEEEIHIPDDPEEWILRVVEVCSIHALSSLLSNGVLSEKWVMENLVDHLPHLCDFDTIMSPHAQKGTLELFILLFRLCEEWENIQVPSLMANVLQPIIVADLVVSSSPEDASAAVLLRCVMKCSPQEPEIAVAATCLSLMEAISNSLTYDDKQSCEVLIHLLDTIVYVAKRPAARSKMGSKEGGSAVEVTLGCLGRLLSFPEKNKMIYDAALQCLHSLSYILQDTSNMERFTAGNGVHLICAAIEEFGETCKELRPGIEKRKHYEMLTRSLELFRIIIMTRSISFQKVVLSPEVMDTLFVVACGTLETCFQEEYRLCDARAKRLAASSLVALPFPSEVGEPCLIAIARRFICMKYDPENLLIGLHQQSFGARMLSRMELSPTGSELLRQKDVVKTLIGFVNQKVEQGEDDVYGAAYIDRRRNALVGLLYLCAADPKTQQYVCSHALYHLLKLAWTIDSECEHALVAKLLELLSGNKNNRTRLYKAEMRARTIVTRWLSEEKDGDQDGGSIKDQDEIRQLVDDLQHKSKQTKTHKKNAYDKDLFGSYEEATAAEELEVIMKLRRKYTRWMRRDLKIREKKRNVIPFSKNPHAQKQAKKKNSQLPKLHQQSQVVDSKESPLWIFRDSILSPLNNLSMVARSNNIQELSTSEHLLLCNILKQPAKLLWTKQDVLTKLFSSDEMKNDPLTASSNTSTSNNSDEEMMEVKELAPWKVTAHADPLLSLVELVPMAACTRDLHVPKIIDVPIVRKKLLDDNSETDLGVILRQVLETTEERNDRHLFMIQPQSLGTYRVMVATDSEFRNKPWDMRGNLRDPPLSLFVVLTRTPKEEKVASIQTCRQVFTETAFYKALPDSEEVDMEAFCSTLVPLYYYHLGRCENDPKAAVDEMLKQFEIKRPALKPGNDLSSALDIIHNHVKNEQIALEKLVNDHFPHQEPLLLFRCSETATQILQDNRLFIEKFFASMKNDWANTLAPHVRSLDISVTDLITAETMSKHLLQSEAEMAADFLARVANMIPLPSAQNLKALTGVDSCDPLFYFQLRTLLKKDDPTKFTGFEEHANQEQYHMHRTRSLMKTLPDPLASLTTHISDNEFAAPLVDKLSFLLNLLRHDKCHDIIVSELREEKVRDIAKRIRRVYPNFKPRQSMSYALISIDTHSKLGAIDFDSLQFCAPGFPQEVCEYLEKKMDELLKEN